MAIARVAERQRTVVSLTELKALRLGKAAPRSGRRAVVYVAFTAASTPSATAA